MGNSSSSSPETEDLPPVDNSDVEKDSYAWPDSLYQEIRDMAEVSFLIYFFAYLINVSRQSGGQANSITVALKELENEIDNGSIVLRQFTPLQIKDIVMNNLELLTDNEHFPINPQTMLDSLGNLLMRVPEDRPQALVMKDYDDVYQTVRPLSVLTTCMYFLLVDVQLMIAFFITPRRNWCTQSERMTSTSVSLWSFEVQRISLQAGQTGGPTSIF